MKGGPRSLPLGSPTVTRSSSLTMNVFLSLPCLKHYTLHSVFEAEISPWPALSCRWLEQHVRDLSLSLSLEARAVCLPRPGRGTVGMGRQLLSGRGRRRLNRYDASFLPSVARLGGCLPSHASPVNSGTSRYRGPGLPTRDNTL